MTGASVVVRSFFYPLVIRQVIASLTKVVKLRLGIIMSTEHISLTNVIKLLLSIIYEFL